MNTNSSSIRPSPPNLSAINGTLRGDIYELEGDFVVRSSKGKEGAMETRETAWIQQRLVGLACSAEFDEGSVAARVNASFQSADIIVKPIMHNLG
ncbi:hypothetical protein Ccrd_022663 [Cynara cardunculus var. scolymus]|uniref:Uncharacterized protein n=1 Tax=Cynara cardunculus var. scolymus TaxID=59895 RepID=A0A103XYG8_CYNCS|nr:hypothetical protein Ccrd_022663 [Cynara cardunculus var. scolymus]